MNKTFLRFWLISSIVAAGITLAYGNGIFGLVAEADITKISFIIMGLYGAYTAAIGYASWKLENIPSYLSVGWFLSEVMLALGMIGTVIGFIYMLSGSMAELDINDTSKTTEVLGAMAAGMATALYTTAVGLICSVLLKIKLVNLEMGVDVDA